MPKEEWGVKRACPECSVRFYDLQQDPMTCPSCGATFTLESLTAVKPRTVRPEKPAPATEGLAAKPDDKSDGDGDNADVDDAEVIDDDDDIADDLLSDTDDDDGDDASDIEDIKDKASDKDDS